MAVTLENKISAIVNAYNKTQLKQNGDGSDSSALFPNNDNTSDDTGSTSSDTSSPSNNSTPFLSENQQATVQTHRGFNFPGFKPKYTRSYVYAQVIQYTINGSNLDANTLKNITPSNLNLTETKSTIKYIKEITSAIAHNDIKSLGNDYKKELGKTSQQNGTQNNLTPIINELYNRISANNPEHQSSTTQSNEPPKDQLEPATLNHESVNADTTSTATKTQNTGEEHTYPKHDSDANKDESTSITHSEQSTHQTDKRQDVLDTINLPSSLKIRKRKKDDDNPQATQHIAPKSNSTNTDSASDTQKSTSENQRNRTENTEEHTSMPHQTHPALQLKPETNKEERRQRNRKNKRNIHGNNQPETNKLPDELSKYITTTITTRLDTKPSKPSEQESNFATKMPAFIKLLEARTEKEKNAIDNDEQDIRSNLREFIPEKITTNFKDQCINLCQQLCNLMLQGKYSGEDIVTYDELPDKPQ